VRFEGDTLICEDCGREIAWDDDYGDEDTPLCSGCSARAYQVFIATPCEFCKKPIGDDLDEIVCNEDMYAHKKCVEKEDPDALEDEWSDEWY